MAFRLAEARAFNEKAAVRIGWKACLPQGAIAEFPGLGSDPGSEEFCKAVLAFQLAHPEEFDLDDERDGKLGQNSWSFMQKVYPGSEAGLIVNGVRIPVAGVKVVTWKDPGGMGFYESGGFRRRPAATPPRVVCWHWDVATSAKRCFGILVNRKLSTHGCVDNDGTMMQYLDLAREVAFAAGSINGFAVNFDASNAVEMAFEEYYRKSSYGPRPVIKDPLSKQSLLDFYPVQAEVMRKVTKATCEALGIPYRLARDKKGAPLLVSSAEFQKKLADGWSGVIGHHNVTERKWDIRPMYGQVFGDAE